MKSISVLTTLIVLLNIALAAEPDLEFAREKIANKILKIERREALTNEDGIASIEEYSVDDLISLYEEYKNHPSLIVRNSVYDNLAGLISRTDNTQKRKGFVEELLDKYQHERNLRIPTNLSSLKLFGENDYTELAKQKIYKMYLETGNSSLFAIAGIANVTNLSSIMKEKAKDNESAMLALARMGDKEEIHNTIALVDKMVVENKTHFFLDRLDYIRQPEAVDKLIEYIEGDYKVRLSGSGALIPIRKIACSFLYNMLEEFPIEENNPGMITDEDIETVRLWLQGKPELKIKR